MKTAVAVEDSAHILAPVSVRTQHPCLELTVKCIMKLARSSSRRTRSPLLDNPDCWYLKGYEYCPTTILVLSDIHDSLLVRFRQVAEGPGEAI